MTPEQKEAAVSVMKGGSVWAAVGITSWSDVAAIAATLYSLLLIGEWLWKKRATIKKFFGVFK
jgi:hypothetical protein